MKEWTLYDQHPRRLLRLRFERSGGWNKTIGLGVEHERTSYGTTYKEPGTNEGRALHLRIGVYHVELLFTWKDLTQNRIDDEESPIHIQTPVPASHRTRRTVRCVAARHV